MLLDNLNLFTVERGISPQTQTNSDSAIVSQIIDLQAKESCTFYMALGNVSDADVTIALKLEESANSDMSSATDITADATKVLGTIPSPTFASDDVTYQFAYIGSKRYVRLTVTPTGNNAGSLPISCVVVSRNKKIGSGPTGS